MDALLCREKNARRSWLAFATAQSTEAGNVRYDSAAFHPVCYCLLLSATALGTDDVTGYADVYDLRHLVTSLK